MRPPLPKRLLTVGAGVNIVLAIPIIAMGFWLALRHHLNCIKFLEIPVLFIGFALVVVSLLGIVGVLRQKLVLVWAYLVLIFLLLLLLFAFILFAFIVTSDGGAHSVPGATFLEYNLGEYSAWLQDQVTDSLKWRSLRACVKDEQICKGLNRQYPTLFDFDNAYLSPLQSGCCKPPNSCGFTFVKPTQWVTPTSSGASSDCQFWSNSGMCYDCNTCKAGLLETVRQDWKKVAKVCLAVFILLIVVYLVSWAAFLKGTSQSHFGRPYPHHGYSQPLPQTS
ncbi:hypothetical protein GOP47_0005028 [Adiantum capillus-veneris]|uniref:Uncharacterized protein n=1 Tax=Adiantum capillus-veneris TaxID=13818 RepID=A0A9D4V4S7_ADICA|nr:hypothetical protein GOP47_0005028 [Adiantum capillus-veneris]